MLSNAYKLALKKCAKKADSTIGFIKCLNVIFKKSIVHFIPKDLCYKVFRRPRMRGFTVDDLDNPPSGAGRFWPASKRVLICVTHDDFTEAKSGNFSPILSILEHELTHVKNPDTDKDSSYYFRTGEIKAFAAELVHHILNNPSRNPKDIIFNRLAESKRNDAGASVLTAIYALADMAYLKNDPKPLELMLKFVNDTLKKNFPSCQRQNVNSESSSLKTQYGI